MVKLKIEFDERNVLRDIIEKQADTLEKAILELVQNARDSVLGHPKDKLPELGFELDIYPDRILIADYGIGFDLKQYAVIGKSVKQVQSGSAIGQFGVGRLQILKYADVVYVKRDEKLTAKWNPETKNLELNHETGVFSIKTPGVAVLVEAKLKQKLTDLELVELVSRLSEQIAITEFDYLIRINGQTIPRIDFSEKSIFDPQEKIKFYDIKTTGKIYYELSDTVETDAPVYQSGLYICHVPLPLTDQRWRLWLHIENADLSLDRSTLGTKPTYAVKTFLIAFYAYQMQELKIPTISQDKLEQILRKMELFDFPYHVPDDIQISGVAQNYSLTIKEMINLKEIYNLTELDAHLFINQGFRSVLNLSLDVANFLERVKGIKIYSDKESLKKLHEFFGDDFHRVRHGYQETTIEIHALWKANMRTAYKTAIFVKWLNESLLLEDPPRNVIWTKTLNYLGCTNGSTWIKINWVYLWKIENAGNTLKRHYFLSELFSTLIHEYCHDTSSYGVQEHTTQFYEKWARLNAKLIPLCIDLWEYYINTRKSDRFLQELVGLWDRQQSWPDIRRDTYPLLLTYKSTAIEQVDVSTVEMKNEVSQISAIDSFKETKRLIENREYARILWNLPRFKRFGSPTTDIEENENE